MISTSSSETASSKTDSSYCSSATSIILLPLAISSLYMVERLELPPWIELDLWARRAWRIWRSVMPLISIDGTSSLSTEDLLARDELFLPPSLEAMEFGGEFCESSSRNDRVSLEKNGEAKDKLLWSDRGGLWWGLWRFMRDIEECGNERMKERVSWFLEVLMGGGERSVIAFGWIGEWSKTVKSVWKISLSTSNGVMGKQVGHSNLCFGLRILHTRVNDRVLP